MADNENDEPDVSPKMLSWIMVAISLLAPMAFSFGFYPEIHFQIEACLWVLHVEGNTIYGPFFALLPSLDRLFIISLRILYVYMFYLYYQNKVSRRTALITGILVEMLPFAVVLYFAGSIPPLAPVPLLLLSGILLMYGLPAKDIHSPWDNESPM
ncbi:MAG: hypothetical protein R6V83_09650 [Candidatus Thorarchaeota archaeon]